MTEEIEPDPDSWKQPRRGVTRYVNYDWLWKKLRNKYIHAYENRIWLVNGAYRVAHESGYDWTVGFCYTLEEAEKLQERLVQDLKRVRKELGKLYAAQQNTWIFLNAVRYQETQIPEAVQERLKTAWHDSVTALREKIDELLPTMIDQDIPFPYSHIIEKRDMDGPIRYHIQEVLRVR